MNHAPNAAADVAIVGGGAAGLATAIFLARRAPQADIVVLDGARKLGAKILVSGGGRCNVTNVRVTPVDFYAGNPHILRRILGAFSERDASSFFHELGVALHEEENGKLFPDSNTARTVLQALLDEAGRRGVRVLTDHRVTRIGRNADSFEVATRHGTLVARVVVLATGGLSLPKTGSDGAGYTFAKALGHSIAPTTPALAPLALDGEFHQRLSGISQDAALTIRTAADKPVRIRGHLLWTHFGVSGPVVLNASRFWHGAKLDGRDVSISASFLPDFAFEAAERLLIDAASAQPRQQLRNTLAATLPARFADALLGHVRIAPDTVMAHLARDVRRRLLHALLEFPLPVRDSRGYASAEVTAGGIPLEEIDPATMASRRCPGLYVVGEILDVDGRIGGFNFQWAWSSAWVAATGIARTLESCDAGETSVHPP